MALTMNVCWKGIDINDAYIKVWRFEGDKNTLSFGVGYYANTNSEMLFSETYKIEHYVLDSPNPVQQAYEHLLTLDEFKSASKC